MFPHVFTLVLYLSVWLWDSPKNQVGIGFNGKAFSQPIYNTIKMYILLSHTPQEHCLPSPTILWQDGGLPLPLLCLSSVFCLSSIWYHVNWPSQGSFSALPVPWYSCISIPNTSITVSIARKDLECAANLFVSCFPVQGKSPLPVVSVAFASPNDSTDLLFLMSMYLRKPQNFSSKAWTLEASWST